ncbi:MAG TPA: hypothetical protein VH328_14245 [Burkholderiaceae bacterium]|jgi:hypothetical protein|nr:hypothetical protein [Burkholderiaceae bacterium]
MRRALISLCVSVAVSMTITACVQYPTETRNVVDQRPLVSFRFDAADTHRADARVLVDGLDAGRVGDYAEGRGALRVLSGNHAIRVVDGDRVLLEERAYLGNGVSRTFALQ